MTKLNDTATSLQAYYTICPVLVASNIAVEFGWLDEEFKRVGASATYLRSLAGNAGWLPPYRHSLNPLFRDGGAIPTIWAKADLTDTTLIATTATQSGGQIVVRADADLYRIDDLRGKLDGEPIVEQQVDPALIGGAVLRVGDIIYDGSIANQLQNLRQHISARSAHEIQSRRDRFRNSAGN